MHGAEHNGQGGSDREMAVNAGDGEGAGEGAGAGADWLGTGKLQTLASIASSPSRLSRSATATPPGVVAASAYAYGSGGASLAQRAWQEAETPPDLRRAHSPPPPPSTSTSTSTSWHQADRVSSDPADSGNVSVFGLTHSSATTPKARQLSFSSEQRESRTPVPPLNPLASNLALTGALGHPRSVDRTGSIISNTAPPVISNANSRRLSRSNPPYPLPVPIMTNLTPDSEHSSRFASPSPAMSTSTSVSKRRRAPAWPSPRHDRPTARDITPNLVTPAALRVPLTAQHSPAFARQGYGAHPYSHVPSSAPLTSSVRLEPPRPSPGRHDRVNLSGVPQSYIVQQLHSLAEIFWWHPETADVRVFIPIERRQKQSRQATMPNSAVSTHSNQPGHSFWPPTPLAPELAAAAAAAGPATRGKQQNVVASHRINRGRRGSVPHGDDVPVLIFPLHKDFLLTQSTLFRALLSTQPHSHLDFAFPNAQSAPPGGPGYPLTAPQGSLRNQQRLRGAKLLPSRDGEPAACYVPVPDPVSFGVIVHWFYWGDISILERALNTGLITWQGVVWNIEYLGMDDAIKRVMGKWWRRWVKTDVGRDVGRPLRSPFGGAVPGGQASADWDSEEEDSRAGDFASPRGGSRSEADAGGEGRGGGRGKGEEGDTEMEVETDRTERGTDEDEVCGLMGAL